MDALFGDAKGPFNGRKSRATPSDITESIAPRTLLPWSVIFSSTNRMVSGAKFTCCENVWTLANFSLNCSG
jgi:hypothetical protein